MKQTVEFIRKGYSTKNLIKEAFQQNSVKGRSGDHN